jgi:antitoxin component of RelBE/YafQ-DinJ toxin-antitoxin module
MDIYDYIYKNNSKMEKSILIRIDKETYEEYKKIIDENGLNMSKRIRKFIESEIEKYRNLDDEKI